MFDPETDREASGLHTALQRLIGEEKALSLRLTTNRQSIVTVRRAPSHYEVRIHKIFSQASSPVLSALGKYIVHDDLVAANELKKFIKAHEDEVARVPPKPRKPRIRSTGKFHDLQPIFDTLNATYFESSLTARITWGARVAARNRQTIKVGSYAVEDSLIRIHPALDQRDVPPLFIAWVVFHEMLHAKYPVEVVGKRRCFHPLALLEEEKRFVGHQEALAWQERNLARLLNS